MLAITKFLTITNKQGTDEPHMKKPQTPNRKRRLLRSSYSNTWQTTLMVMFIVMISVGLSIWFFWRSFYLPELKNHSRYLATELNILDDISQNGFKTHEERERLRSKMHTAFIDDPAEFPTVEEKKFAGFFTDIMQKEMSEQMNRPIQVFFKFKPTSHLWVQDSKHPEYWIREPVTYYSQYNPTLIVSFLLGIPILTLLTILLLARQLNRPLRHLQRAANNYIQMGQASTLPTNKGSTEIRQVNLAFNRLFTTLNQAQKERTIMLAGISHDLRTPLTRMRLTAEMLPDEFFREGLIYDIEDMDAILEQFISFMKDGSDEPVHLTDLGAIFHEVIVQFAPTPIIYEASKALPPIPLRSLSIKRLIINLVNNANKYGKPPIYLTAEIVPTFNQLKESMEPAEEDVEITAQSALAQQAKEKLIIGVRDCGEGVDDDQLERIMQPFERGETARTTKGSGLGLAIVNRIAHLHHGHVEAINHPEGGLQVTVHLPLLSKVTDKNVN